MADERLEIAIKAVNEASKALREVHKDLGGLDDQAKKTSGGMDLLGKAAKVAGGLLTLKLAKEGLEFVIGSAMEAEKVMAATEAVIKSTGGAAGLTADEVSNLATRFSNLTGIDDELIQSAENVLLTFTSIGEDVFPQAMEAALNMSTALGTDLQGAVIMVGKALQDPVAGLTALRRAGVNVNAEMKGTVKALVDAGKESEAMALILKELNTEFGGAAKAAGDTFAGKLGKAQVALGNLGESIGNKLLPILGDIADGLVRMLTHMDKLRESTKASGEEILKNADGYAHYRAAQERLAESLDAEINAAGELVRVDRFLGIALSEVELGTRVLSEAEFESTQIAARLGDERRENIEAMQANQVAAAELRGVIEEELIPTEEELAKAEEAAAKAAEEQARALDKARDSASTAAEGFFGLAQAYTEGVTKLDTVKRALDAIDEAQRKGIITDGERRTAQEQIMLQYGLTSEAGLVMARAEEEVNRLLDAGLLSATNYTTALTLIPAAAKDGKVNMDELGEGARIAAEKMGDAEQHAEQLRDRIAQLESKDITVTTIFRQELHEQRFGPGGRLLGGGRQFGGPVFGGRSVIVGEGGPELFVPGASGGILSNTDMRRVIALLETIAGGLSRPNQTTINASGVDLSDLSQRARGLRMVGIGSSV